MFLGCTNLCERLICSLKLQVESKLCDSYLYPQNNFYMWMKYISVIYCTNTQRKRLHTINSTFKVLNILLQSVGLTKDCSLAIVLGFLNLLVVPENKRKFIVFSFWHIDSILLKMHYFITCWPLFSECWCNGLLKCISFTYQKIILGKRHTLNIKSNVNIFEYPWSLFLANDTFRPNNDCLSLILWECFKKDTLLKNALYD